MEAECPHELREHLVLGNPPTYTHVSEASVFSTVHPVVGAVDKDVHAKAEVPWWAWGIPGAIPFLAMAISNAEGNAWREGGKIADSIAARLDTVFRTPKNLRNARVYVDSATKHAAFDITDCPPLPASKP